jgi:beta-glucosidase
MKVSTLCGVTVLAAITHAADCKPVYKNPNATIDDRVSDLLKRMSVEEKAAQLIQGDLRDYQAVDNDGNNGDFNQTGLEWVMSTRAHAIWTGLYVMPEDLKAAAKIGQDYAVNETKLGENPFS